MNNFKTGTIETVYKVLNSTADPLGLFQKLKKSENAFLLESADIIKKYGEKSIGCTEPCLKITIKDSRFEIKALNKTGEKILYYIKNDFSFATGLKKSSNQITGRIEKNKDLKDEDARLKEKNVFDVLRVIAFKFKPKVRLNMPFCGLFGVISYDAVDYFEDLPKQKDIEDGVPDAEFYFADKLFIMDHIQKKTYLVANFFVTGENSGDDYYACMDVINRYEKAFKESTDYAVTDSCSSNKVEASVSDDDFKNSVKKIKEHINQGDIFQCVLSRTFKTKVNNKPLDTYALLKKINPGPYMFYFQNKNYVLLGSSPETCLKISGTDKKIVEIKPIAGTLPRGKNPELDSRYELNLLLDEKELAEHCMLLDLARNDIAKVSLAGTRETPEVLKVEKFSHVQHLVSRVKGMLRPDLDALHAYTATMNMGTLTGAPKIKAMELIRKYEQEKRGFYGGAVCYLTPYGEFDSCIVIRAIMVKDNVASVRAGAGIVYDSDPCKEAEETKRKARACLVALGVEE